MMMNDPTVARITKENNFLRQKVSILEARIINLQNLLEESKKEISILKEKILIHDNIEINLFYKELR